MLDRYHFDAELLAEEIQQRGWKRIALQAPEGLARDVLQIAFFLSGRGLEACILMDPCYGACDLASPPEGFHGVVHLGHAPLPGQDALFVELRARACRLEKLETMVLPDTVGIAATVQHLDLIPVAKNILEEREKTVLVGAPDDTSRTAHPGQILGCDLSSARNISGEVGAFVLLASGVFHGRGLAAATGKPVYVLDPHTGEVAEVDGERLLRQRHGLIESSREAKRFGVVVSTKPGQKRMAEAELLAEELRKTGREAVLVFVERMEPNVFRGLGLDALVSTACPRIALDDYSNYPVPVLTPCDARVMLGLTWDDYRMDEILFNRDNC